MKYRLTEQAEQDVSHILTDTYRMFGEMQFARYVRILDTGIEMVANEPFRATSKDRRDIREGVRSFHLHLAAGRQGGASHIIYYRPPIKSETDPVVILRVLGDEMEPRRHIASTLRTENEDSRK